MKIHTYSLALLGFMLTSGWVQAQGLLLTRGAHLVVTGAPNLVLNNTGLKNDGQFIADRSTVLFAGNGPQGGPGNSPGAFIDGNNPIAFYRLTINRSSGDVVLRNNTAVTGDITMQNGNLRLNNYTLDLGTSGRILGEKSSSCITGAEGGTIKAIALLNAPQGVNPGNIGVAFTSEAYLGRTLITRGHVRQGGAGAGDGDGIQRYFEIDPENNLNSQVTLRCYYLDGELAGMNGDELALFSKEGAGWAYRGKDGSDRIAGWVAKENVGLLRRFTLAIPGGKGVATWTTSLSVAPNPSSGVFRMILVSDSEKDRVVKLYDLLGHVLQIKKIHCMAGMNTVEWYVAGLAQGTYHLAAEGMAPVAVLIR